MDAERLCGTACLLHAQLGNLRTSWNRRIGGTLRAIRRDNHLDLDALTCIPGEDRRDRPFIVGMCPDCYERPSLSLTTGDWPGDKDQCRNNGADDDTHRSSPSHDAGARRTSSERAANNGASDRPDVKDGMADLSFELHSQVHTGDRLRR
jgi:hypothetical protein